MRSNQLHDLMEMFTYHYKIWSLEWSKNNDLGISTTCVTILNILVNEGSKQAKDLVTALFITSGGVTGVTNRLVKAGLILRKRDEEGDRRSINFEITDKGREVLALANVRRSELMEKFYRSLTDGDVKKLYQIYNKMHYDVQDDDFQVY
ncbi:MAG: MarR family transcriptional regulator [Paenibacillaceae bacterium]